MDLHMNNAVVAITKLVSEVLVLIVTYSLSFLWLAGIVIAQGFWSTFFSIFFPPYAFYLIVEKLLIFGEII
jgi:hypothetical protein